MNLGELEGQTNIKVNAFDKKVIYIYKHIGVASHEGWLKVGETKRSNITGEGKNLRIIDQHTAANIPYEVLYTTDAVTNSGYIFSDHDIHQLLEGMDIERQEKLDSETGKPSEWFKTDLQTVIDAIEKYKMEAYEDQEGKIVQFTLRKEQSEAVAVTHDYYDECIEKNNLQPSFLWNAKPRFGKTLTAYCFASEIQAKKVLIVTNRPAIADSWYTDFCRFDFADNGQNDGKFRWVFTASDAVKNNLNSPTIYTREDQLANPVLRERNTVHFISLQDIKGLEKDEDGTSTAEFKAKNQWLFDWNWDLVIIDESHEGVDTHRAFKVFEKINTTFTLHLSGTPFKALASNKFSSNQIYNWSYTDEQFAKENWPIVDGTNPYAELPKMNIFTYQLSRALELTAEDAKNEESEYAFDLAEFFRVATIDGKDRFVHEDEVKHFIRNLSNSKFQYPFSSSEYRESLRHTFWLLPRVKACEQMKQLLLEDEYFGSHYTKEDIIVAAGDGDDDRKAKTALDAVRTRIGKPGTGKHPLETRTITLSCGQLTTGVTVPAWTAVLMLNNCKSPAQYMQAAFRAQNPFKIATSGNECFMKENCFVFDFAPDRILQTLAEMADSINHGPGTQTREEKVKILINFLPVIAEDNEGKMKYLDANEVLTIPLKLITEEVVNRGFMSNRLFENISNIFGCPQSVKDIIAKMDEAKGRDVNKGKDKTPVKPTVRIWTDNDNKIHINEDIVVNTTNGLFGEKRYVEIGSDEGKEVQATIEEALVQARENGYDTESIKAVQKAITKKMPSLVVKIPDPAPKPGDPNYHEKEKPDEKPKPKEKSEEEKVRDRLRGFARTIPSFLMAYGTKDTNLRNFGDNIPEDVFLELTNITKDEFKKLRDGFDYEKVEEDGTKTQSHFPSLFNENVFNSSVQAFEEKQKELACYYHTDSEEDIFEYIPPQANNQIFTPKRVVRMMIDMLEKENPGIFNSTTNTFIDLYMKSGMYITEIVRRIFDQTRDQYPSDTACVKHILENQVYGFAPSPILDAITKNYIFGFDEDGYISKNNFKEYNAIPAAKDGTLKQEINRLFNPQGGDMKFTAVVGNPPYQIEDKKEDVDNSKIARTSAIPVYNFFVDASKQITDRFVSLIMPSRWMTGGRGLDDFRKENIKDERYSIIHDFENDREVFPNNDVGGGVMYFLWDNTHTGELDYFLHNYDEIVHDRRLLDTGDGIVIRDYKSAKILEKIKSPDSFAELVSAQKPFGYRADATRRYPELFSDTQDTQHTIKFYCWDGTPMIKYMNKKDIADSDLLASWKIFISKTADPPIRFGHQNKEILRKPFIGEPNTACSETYLYIGNNFSKEEAHNALKYIQTKLFRFLVLQRKKTQNVARGVFESVPMQKFTDNSDIDWSKSIPEIDQQLYKKYNLSEDEIKFIEEKVAPME
ncbi:Eco57I restriction-modification methylase domain-containing protein [Candidatus Saccharibacteria bacterium]|nr:Eco57I restriction-modification methylase domain-containing protein [Candidatus Saccharibacteria bacterium]